MNYLRKALCLSLLLAVILSCSKDRSGPEPTDRSGNLAGTWQVVAYSFVGSKTTLVFDEIDIEEFQGIGADFNYIMNFSEGPNTFQSMGDFIYTITVTDENGTSSTGANVLVSDSGSWEKNENVITFDLEDETFNVTISELTDNTLKYARNVDRNVVDGFTSVTTTGVEKFILFRLN